MSSEILDENGRALEVEEPKSVETPVEEPKEEEKAKIAVDDKNKLTKVMHNGKEYKVTNSVTVMEILVHKLEDGQELSQVVAHEFMMTDHKPYMIKLLTEAINTVMRATKREPLIKLVTKAGLSRLGFLKNRLHKNGRGK